MSYPTDLLSTRAVNNVIPGIEGGKVSIVCSPKMGAGFTQYIINAKKDCRTTQPFGTDSHIECFIYIVEGETSLTVGEKTQVYGAGGYAFAPAGEGISFQVLNSFYINKYLFRIRN